LILRDRMLAMAGPRVCWVQSGGGPLVVIAYESLGAWRGVNELPESSETDYDRARAVHGELGSIACGDGFALVLGDAPHQTTWLSGKLVRWVYAESEQDAVSAVASATSIEPEPTTVRFVTGSSGRCVLFDAAEPGSDIQGDELVIELEPGDYLVDSATIEPDRNTKLVLHRFRPQTEGRDSF